MLVVGKTKRFSVLNVCAAASEDPALFERLISWFDNDHVEYETISHEPTLTSEASVRARVRLGWTETTLKCGAKAMLMRRKPKKPEESLYALCVLAADRKLEYKKLKKNVGKDMRMATEQEVFEASKCLPGAVPPFGSKFFANPPPLTYVDDSLTLNDVINFNCGLRTRSVKMTLSTYIQLENPTITQFSS